MRLIEYFKINKTCQHDKVKPDVDFAYCPDCGELVENQWYLVRCSCCGVKLRGMVKNGEIIAEEKFCNNCGSKGYVIEKLDKINFVDIRYAVLIKAVVKSNLKTFTQSWIDPKMEQYRRLIAANSY